MLSVCDRCKFNIRGIYSGNSGLEIQGLLGAHILIGFTSSHRQEDVRSAVSGSTLVNNSLLRIGIKIIAEEYFLRPRNTCEETTVIGIKEIYVL